MVFRWLADKSWHKLDYIIFIILAFLALFSLLAIQGATGDPDETGGMSSFAQKQLVWILGSAVLLIVISLIDIKIFKKLALPLYIFGIGLLVYVQIDGSSAQEAVRWIDFGFVRFQPSEFVKISTILLLAKELSNYGGEIVDFRDIIKPLVIVAIPFVFLLMQPDLGTAMIFVAMVAGMFLVAGVNWRIYLILLLIVAILLVSLVLLLYINEDVFYKIIKPYQLKRLTSFFDGEEDLLGGDFQKNQSLIAIGSGQLLGKGLYKGDQVRGGWIPENHTDFIFAVIAEEFGFVGVSFLLALYFFLLYRFLVAAGSTRDLFGCLTITGIISFLIFQIYQNIGMTVGLMPITGITLPFISYGGTSLMAAYVAVGLVISVSLSDRKPSLFGKDE